VINLKKTKLLCLYVIVISGLILLMFIGNYMTFCGTSFKIIGIAIIAIIAIILNLLAIVLSYCFKSKTVSNTIATFVVAMGVFILISIIFLSTSYFFKSKEIPKDYFGLNISKVDSNNFTGNLFNDIIFEKDWNYYINTGDGFKLYKIDKSGKHTVKLADEHVSKLLDVKNGWIYYISNNNIFRAKTSGANGQMIIEGNNGISEFGNITITDKNIYYLFNNCQYKTGLNGENQKKLTNFGYEVVYVQNDNLYLSGENNCIYRSDLDCANITFVAKIKSRNSYFYNGCLYYVCDDSKKNLGRIYKMTLDKGYEQMVGGENANWIMSVDDDTIYYTKEGGPYYYKLSKDGSEKFICNDIMAISFLGNWMFTLEDYQNISAKKINGSTAPLLIWKHY
jgi:hypothetical protein